MPTCQRFVSDFNLSLLTQNEQLSRGGARNRSFRIEDDPMGDNFRQSLEDIRIGYRDAAPRVC